MTGEGRCVLVTGGAGYIGTHTTVEVINAGYKPVIVDNLVNASVESIKRVEKITCQEIPYYNVNLLDKAALSTVFKKHKFDYVMHFAGLKAVGESCQKPLSYYRNNLEGTMTLLEVMQEYGVHNLIFSSSATVYGDPEYLPLDEKHPVGGCTNPYGKTKYFIEEILADVCKAEKVNRAQSAADGKIQNYNKQQWNIVCLRYFNPIGSHKSGEIGEDPQGIPNNLMPYISQVAVGRRPHLDVFGTDYDTKDGTGVRDYIHVVDLAKGHVAAIKQLDNCCGNKVFNLGTGTGYSVLEMVKAFEKASSKPVPYKLCDRRVGDIASCYADPVLAEKELGWKAMKGLDEMCEDLWRWCSMNPYGYKGCKE